jgi:predicted RNA binding protein YcfA (HicA-like mRNA interferase family)
MVHVLSKLPRKVSGQDILKVLRKHGFTIRRGRGSHMGAWKRIGDKTKVVKERLMLSFGIGFFQLPHEEPEG